VVNLTINGAPIDSEIVVPSPWNPQESRAKFDLGNTDIQVGDVVSVTDEVIEKSLIVTAFEVTGFDPTADSVSGWATPGAGVWVDADDVGLNVQADGITGLWMADFSSLVDLTTISNGSAAEWDSDLDGTWYDWGAPSPEFMLNIQNDSSWDELTAWNWPLGAQVTLTVDNPDTSQNPDYTEVQIMGLRSGGHPTGASYLQGNEFQGHPGFIITLSDGVQEKSMVVPLLQGTEYNVEADTVSGVTDPFASVVVACDVGAEPTVIADSEGNWMANFRDSEDPNIVLYDIQPGTWCEPQMYDNDHDHIVLRDWFAPNPYIQASAQSDWVLANGWMEGTAVNLTINGVSHGSAVMGPASWNPNRIVGEFDLGGSDIQVGNAITIEGSGITKTLIVSAIHITNINQVANTVSGEANAGAEVYVRASPGGDWVERWITASDPGGVWSVDFTPDYDLVPGSNGFAQEYDEDGDATLVDWDVPFGDTDGDGIADDSDNAPSIFNPDQRDVDNDSTADVLDPCPDDAMNTCDTNGSAVSVIGEQGGTVTTSNGKAGLNIPAGSVHEDISFTITNMGGGYEIASNEGPMLVVQRYSIQPNGTQFDPPASIVFRWEDTDNDGIVDGTSLQEADILLVKDGVVITPSCDINPDCNMAVNELTVQVSDLSLFALAVPVEWTLKGFYRPVDMNGVYNIVKNGSTVPLKFEIFAGSTELTYTAYVKSLAYAQTSCAATATTDEIETTATGGTSLRYDSSAGQFIYNWKTPSTAGKCYRVTMTAMDGSSLVAYFKLR
jgi:hypothetical protein